MEKIYVLEVTPSASITFDYPTTPDEQPHRHQAKYFQIPESRLGKIRSILRACFGHLRSNLKLLWFWMALLAILNICELLTTLLKTLPFNQKQFIKKHLDVNGIYTAIIYTLSVLLPVLPLFCIATADCYLATSIPGLQKTLA
ncbi:unnamed protein product [Didymodactylos carnosus]|uniref:Uncharacterized protein n=1 Tax=Didymodactylos carnosus TaxID=1234261 RepID=A0A813QWM2_9BILA|nr:unnamed protein product [Didymodactylos carnosus]CAF3554984.1 unnamed protein product [Didymodactylos carnosus]